MARKESEGGRVEDLPMGCVWLIILIPLAIFYVLALAIVAMAVASGQL